VCLHGWSSPKKEPAWTLKVMVLLSFWMSKTIWVTHYHILEDEFSAIPLSAAQMLHCHTLFGLNIVDLTNDIRDSRSSNAEDLIFLQHGCHPLTRHHVREELNLCLDRAVFSALLSAFTQKLVFVGSHRCFPNYTVRYRICSNVLEEVWVNKSQWTVYKTRRPMSDEKQPCKEPKVLTAFLLATHPTIRTCNFAEPVCCLVTSSYKWTQQDSLKCQQKF
jgi:hypothetical protein